MKRMIIVIAIIALFIGVIYVGVLPGLNMLGDEGYETQSKWYNNYQGCPDKEMFLPEDRKGFITSYRSDLLYGASETIVVSGRYKFQIGWSEIKQVKYVIKWKADPWSDWVTVSKPGYTENWISVANPGDVRPDYSGTPGIRQCEPYVFNILGRRDGAIRAELWGYFDPSQLNPFDGWEWHLIGSDQALLHSGVCGMWLPIKDDGTYQSTFEIDETVKIKVETGVGNADVSTSDASKSWELHLLKPDGSDYTGQSFPRKLSDHFQGTISFKVNDDMFNLGGNNRWTLQLYNVLWKKGTLEISTIDFLAKMPSKPTISPDCGLSVEVPETVTVTISATPNTETQLAIQSFGVMVWYGKYSDLAPGSWGEERWILRQTMVSASKSGDTYTGSFSFDVNKPDLYFTILVYTHDTDGRDSDTEYYQVKTFGTGDSEPDEGDLVDEGGGQGSYGGGTSGMTVPWGHLDTTVIIDYLPLILAIAIFIIMLIIAFIPQIPIPFGMYGRLMVVVLGAVLAVLIYWFMGGDMG